MRGRKSTTYLAIFLLAIISTCSCAHTSKTPGSEAPPTYTPNPTTILVKTRLEQLKQMEESALKGWYDMVKEFLLLIQPDTQTLDIVLQYVNNQHSLEDMSTILTIVKMNSAFLAMVAIGLIYVIVMLLTGLFFFCCRQCGRCGAKDSQRQRHNDNCWRTIHKFFLVFMIAFLVVPITCMCIINQHMKQSLPSVKSNASGVLTILGDFANSTDEDVNRITIGPIFGPDNVQNFAEFKKYFVDEVQKDISESIDNEKLEEIKNIVTWVLTVEDQHASIANASALSEAIKELKSMIANIREQTKNLHNCSNPESKMCQLRLRQLPLEKINVSEEYGQVHREFQELLKINFLELKNAIDKIQNNSILRKMIEKESESLKQFADDIKPKEQKILEGLKTQVKVYTDELRKFSAEGKDVVDHGLARTDEYEEYRWWSMFGITVILVVPVAFLCLGLTCACFGYKKDRHPTKRSSLSNCGGICFILAVYYFFLIASATMLLTIALFIVGGNVQSFVCTPMYQDSFETLDEMKEKFSDFTNGTVFQNVTPSQFLTDCREDKPILQALGFINESDPGSYEKIFKEKIKGSSADEDLDRKLKTALFDITSGIRSELNRFTTLDLGDMRELPKKLENWLKSSKSSMSSFIEEVQVAFNEEHANNLYAVNESAAVLWERVDDFEKKLRNLSSTLMNIYISADSYKEKMRDMTQDLDDVEAKLPKIIKEHLIQAAADSINLREKLSEVGRCEPLWIAFDTARTAVCDFVVNPINGFWFGLGWILAFIIPTMLFAIKLSRYYLKMKYDDDPHLHDSREAIPLEEMNRTKPFSYTQPPAVSWMPQFGQHQNYIVHPTSGSQVRQFHYK